MEVYAGVWSTHSDNWVGLNIFLSILLTTPITECVYISMSSFQTPFGLIALNSFSWHHMMKYEGQRQKLTSLPVDLLSHDASSTHRSCDY